MLTIGDILFLLFIAVIALSLIATPFLMIRNRRRESKSVRESRSLILNSGGLLKLSDDVLSMPLPAGLLGVRSSIAGFLLGFLLLAFLMTMFFISLFDSEELTDPWVIGVLTAIVGTLLLIYSLGFLYQIRRTKRYIVEPVDLLPNRSCLEALQQSGIPLVPSTGARGRRAWTRLKEAFEERQLSCPRTVVDVLYLPSVKEIESIENLREPVPILAGSHRLMRQSVVGLLSTALLTAYFVAIGQWWLSGILFLIAMYYAATTPVVRNAVPGLRLDSLGTLAGPGFIKNRRGQIWRHNDSMLMVRAADRKRKSLAAVQAIFLGPEGQWSMVFPSISDSDFQLLWALWNTMDPRPELADAEY